MSTRLSPATLIATGLFTIVLAVFLFLHATRPLSNSDFWWHLKSGETMVAIHGLLHADPFNIETGGEQTLQEKVVLKGYWLWQVSAYGLYALLGFNGIFLLNLLSVGAIAVCLALQMRRFAINWGVAAPLLAMGFTLFHKYDLERPTSMTFLCAVLLMGLLLEVRRGGRLGPALPVVMCLWANLHGGYVVGDLMLICFAAGTLIEYRHDLSKAKALLLWTGAAIGASFLNPNGPLALYFALAQFESVGSTVEIIEYTSTWRVFLEGGTTVVILWILVGLYFLGVALNRRIYWPEFLIALFLAWFSIRYQRNIAFFALAMLPATGFNWQAATGNWRLPRLLAPLAVIIAAIALLLPVQEQWRTRPPAGVKVAPIYPDAAISFIEQTGIEGRMFNSYEYGGYLVWRVAPRMKIFIDGRNFDQNVYLDYGKISGASQAPANGGREYEVLLEKYGIEFVLQPIYDGYGNVQPLMKVLLGKPEWVPVYLDSVVYILARDTEKSRSVISRHGIVKDQFKARLLGIYSSLQNSYPQEVSFRVARAGMLIYLGRYQEARAEVETIAAIAPNEKTLPNLRRELNLLAGRMLR